MEINTWADIKENLEILFNTDIDSDITHKSDYCVDVTGHDLDGYTRDETVIEQSALALLKIHILIEYGYGGIVTAHDWETLENIYVIYFDPINYKFGIYNSKPMRFFNHIAFKTFEQANRFLSYPENQELIKDFYMQ